MYLPEGKKTDHLFVQPALICRRCETPSASSSGEGGRLRAQHQPCTSGWAQHHQELLKIGVLVVVAAVPARMSPQGCTSSASPGAGNESTCTVLLSLQATDARKLHADVKLDL